MSENGFLSNDVSRREAMKTAMKAGVYAAPVILSAVVPAVGVAAATPPGPTGILIGRITNASNGAAIPGATVTVGGASTLTDANGNYTLSNAPAGAQTVMTSAPGFTSRTDPVSIAANTTTTFSTSLVPSSASGNITIVLTWGAQPLDLDSHLTGPDVVNGGRFHVFYVNKTPVPYASLDHDTVTGFGPETVTVQPFTGGLFVPGDYHYYVDNYSVTPGFNASPAIVTVFQSGAQIAQFSASNAAGSPALREWYVFNFTLTATTTGQIAITPVMQFTGTVPNVDRVTLPAKHA